MTDKPRVINAKEYCIECNLKNIATIMVDCLQELPNKKKDYVRKRINEVRELTDKILVTLDAWTDDCCKE